MSSGAQSTPIVHTVTARIAGRYLVRPPAGSGPSPLLVGFHGYGENAEQHLAEALRLPGASEWLLVSVQALNRFYERKTGTVVASWMTSQDREQVIADNLAYVGSIVAHVTREYATLSTVVYCGFSQGVAMAYRAAHRDGGHPAGVIALAGDVPPELRADTAATWPRVLIGRGVRDAFYTREKMDVDVTALRERGTPVETVVFDGGHEWHDDFRTAAGRLLHQVCQ